MTYGKRFPPIDEMAVAPATSARSASIKWPEAIYSLNAAAFHYAFFSGPRKLAPFSAFGCTYLGLTVVLPILTPSASIIPYP